MNSTSIYWRHVASNFPKDEEFDEAFLGGEGAFTVVLGQPAAVGSGLSGSESVALLLKQRDRPLRATTNAAAKAAE